MSELNPTDAAEMVRVMARYLLDVMREPHAWSARQGPLMRLAGYGDDPIAAVRDWCERNGVTFNERKGIE